MRPTKRSKSGMKQGGPVSGRTAPVVVGKLFRIPEDVEAAAPLRFSGASQHYDDFHHKQIKTAWLASERAFAGGICLTGELPDDRYSGDVAASVAREIMDALVIPFNWTGEVEKPVFGDRVIPASRDGKCSLTLHWSGMHVPTQTGPDADRKVVANARRKSSSGPSLLIARQQRADAFDRLFADLPADLDGCARVLMSITNALRQHVAARFAPVLNANLRVTDPTDAEAKKQLARAVMGKLTELGLAIRCPVTGQPSTLIGQQDSKNPRGRFSITPKGANRPSLSRTSLCDLLPLELVVDRPRREALNEWREQVKRQVRAQADTLDS